MSDEGKSYRQILRSTSIIGGASVINILIGLVRVKVAAVLLGPTGVGLIGLFSNLVATAANIAALGMGTVGTRNIASAAGRQDSHALTVTTRALFWGTLIMATLGSLIFWLLRDILALHVFSEPSLGDEVGWLSLGVGLTVLVGSQGALLNGFRRIGDLARISVYSAAISTLLGVGALAKWQDRGLLAYLLLTPIASFVVGYWYVKRLPKQQNQHTKFRELMQHWRTLTQLGMAVMLAGLAMTLGQLLVRTLVQRELGAEALGLFEASWVISMTYIGFVLRAMGTDYYPRLTEVIHNKEAANKLVNEQTEVALLIGGPIILAMLSTAPWIIEALYSEKFTNATIILRWQLLGDILKIISFPLGFVILAAGDGRNFILSDAIAATAFTLCTWVGISHFGLQATGMGFFAMYALYLPTVYWLAKKRTGFSWHPSNIKTMIHLGAAYLIIFALSNINPRIAGATGMAASLFLSIKSIRHLCKRIPSLDRRWQQCRHLLKFKCRDAP